MAEIKFKYREGYCDLGFMTNGYYCWQCHTEDACCLGCKQYYSGEYINDEGIKVICNGDCIHSGYEYKYKGVSTKNWECELIYNNFTLDEYLLLTVGKKQYECTEVLIDGIDMMEKLREDEQ